MKSIQAAVLCALLTISISASASGTVIPADRLFDWSQAGIPGGIPNRTGVFATIPAKLGNGTTDATKAIQDAISGCPENQVVLLPEGTIRLTATIRMKAGVVLRGAGMGKTILRMDAGPANVILFQHAPWHYVDEAVLSGYERGSTNITVADAKHVQVGMQIKIDQQNDMDFNSPTHVVNQFGTEGPGTLPNREYTRAVSQIIEVTKKSGNSLTFIPPLAWTLRRSQTPKIFFGVQPNQQDATKNSSMLVNSGIEELTIDSGKVSESIRGESAAYCWVKSVESRGAINNHVNFINCFRCNIESSIVQKSATGGASAGYGVMLQAASTLNLVQNNIANQVLCMAMLQGGLGNVFAYNYSFDNLYYDPEWLQADYVTHTLHPSFNLFEGNIGHRFAADFIHGSASHQVVFRNHFKGYDVGTTHQNRPFELSCWNRYHTAVGNVLGDSTWSSSQDRFEISDGSPGSQTQKVIWTLGYRYTLTSGQEGFDARVKETLLRHGNYDFVSLSTKWDPSIADRTLPASLYLKTKPTWWGDLPWPSIGPDARPMVGKIPAQVRFEQLQSQSR